MTGINGMTGILRMTGMKRLKKKFKDFSRTFKDIFSIVERLQTET